MFLDEYREFCLSLPGTSEALPFGDKALVFKVMDKVFALTGVDSFASVNLKCDPEYAVELRERHDFIKGGYHMNKKHWNTIYEPELIDEKLLKELTQHSYELVVAKLTKKLQKELKALN